MTESSLFADPVSLLSGAATGLIFGFLLQRGGVTRFETIVGQFLLKDYTVLKVMLTAVIVGGIGVYSLSALGAVDTFHIKSAALLGTAVGSAIFALGMVLLGFCPGTAVAAIGEGSKDALVGVAGMLLGAALYSAAHPWLKEHVLNVADIGKQTFAGMLGVSPFGVLALVAVVGIAIFWAIEKWEKGNVGATPAV